MCVAGFGYNVFILNSLPWGLGIGIVAVVLYFICKNASISNRVDNECSDKLRSAKHKYEQDCEMYDKKCKSTLEEHDKNYRKTVQNFLSSFENARVPASPESAGHEHKNDETSD